MSGGPIGDGVVYWANIKISGTMDKNQLAAIRAAIVNALGQHGSIVTEARVSEKDANTQFQVAYRK